MITNDLILLPIIIIIIIIIIINGVMQTKDIWKQDLVANIWAQEA